ncbi:hypothetical protein HELRODRAFT_116562 [Helobdella robusta]|uniref:Lengsin n=1 Tax=Helobdella robusta TaxID=6412 RepID=T1EGG1_HELRO|nr:hypothetical protein HELRODRAFT_116562 [Helobdella robusta]ESN90165.1 hypothetical protein HELRODRAFT_116562 [Helobdella robusta]
MLEQGFDIKELHEVEKKIGKKFDYMRFSFADFNGIARGVSMPRRQAVKALKSGFSLFLGNITLGPRGEPSSSKEIVDLRFPNCNFIPSPATLTHLAWAGRKKDFLSETDQRVVGQVLCESAWTAPFRNGSAIDSLPRFILRRQLDRLEKLGYIFKSAFEVEFTLYDEKTGLPVFNGLDAVTTLVLAKFEDYLYTLEENLKMAGVEVTSMLVEHGLGQFELTLEPLDGVKSADALFICKQAIKEISIQRGYVASFMSKPSKYASANGLHLNMSLWKKEEDGKLVNAFYDDNDQYGLSKVHRSWIAGLIKHGKSLSALHSPTYNCYRRFHKFLAPDVITWGIDDRTVPFRAKSCSPSATYCECRMPSGASNPYLVVASAIAAGMDGIINELELPERATNVMLSIDATPEGGRQADTESVKYFPYSLAEALKELERDDLMRNSLGEEFVRWFVQLKYETEINVLSPLNDEDKWIKEKELYFEFI